MQQVSDLIKTAFYRAGIRDNMQEIKGEDMERGLSVLNSMMHRLQADGKLIAWADVTADTDALLILKQQERPLTYILAMELCAEYQVQPSELVVKFYNDSMDDMARDAIQAAPHVSDVSHMPSEARGTFDIVSGA